MPRAMVAVLVPEAAAEKDSAVERPALGRWMSTAGGSTRCRCGLEQEDAADPNLVSCARDPDVPGPRRSLRCPAFAGQLPIG